MNFKLSTLLLLVSLAASVSCQCWKSAYGREMGSAVSTCPSGYDVEKIRNFNFLVPQT